MAKVRDSLSTRIVSYAIEAQGIAEKEPKLAFAMRHVATSSLAVLSALEVFADACVLASDSCSDRVDGGTRRKVGDVFSVLSEDMRNTISEVREHFELFSVMGASTGGKEGGRIDAMAKAHGLDTGPAIIERQDIPPDLRVVEPASSPKKRRRA